MKKITHLLLISTLFFITSLSYATNQGITSQAPLTVAQCDANGDSTVNIQDVIAIINKVLQGGEVTTGTDCTGDGVVNIQDVVAVINLVLSGGGSQTDTITLSGVAFDSAIVGGNVTFYDSLMSSLGTTTTDNAGKYSIELPVDSIANGYHVEITGGTMDGESFTEKLTATYSSSDNREQVNLTPITSLIDSLASYLTADMLVKRDHVIETLVGLGIIPSSKWQNIESSWFNLSALSEHIKQMGGVGIWIDTIETEMSNGELSIQQVRSIFPKAYGGVERVFVEQANLSLFSGRNMLVPIKTEPVLTDAEKITQLIQAPEWVTLEEGVLFIDPAFNISAGEYTFSVEVTTAELTVGRKKAFVVTVLDKVVLLSGSLGIDGGRLENEWKDIILEVPANTLTQQHDFNYIAGLNAQGEITFNLESTPEISEEELDSITVTKPLAESLALSYLQPEQGEALSPNSSQNGSSHAPQLYDANSIRKNVCNRTVSNLFAEDTDKDNLALLI